VVFSDLVARLFQKDAPPRHPTQLDSPATIYAIVTVLSNIGGWLPGYLMRRVGPSPVRAKPQCSFLRFALVPILFATSVGDWSAVLLIGLAGAAHQAWSANLYSTASDMFPKNAVASLIGIEDAAGSVAV